MKKLKRKTYPDISNVLAVKLRRRQELAAESWEEKMIIVERMRASMPKGQWNKADS
jgi:hypothetical protein